MPGTLELALIFLVILLFIGPKKIPEIARSVGKAIREFRKSLKEEDNSSDSEKSDSP